MDFKNYLVRSGVTEVEAEKIATHVISWDELHHWMDAHYPGTIHPPIPSRVPIGAPEVERNWRKNLVSKFKEMKASGVPVGIEPEWIHIVDRRQKTSMFITVFVTSLIVYLTAQILNIRHVDYGLQDMLLANSYLILNAIMTYFMVLTFTKQIIGSYHALRGPEKNPWHPIHTAIDPRKDIRVAIVFPVYHEEVARVSAGMGAVWESLRKQTPECAGQYDIFLISDSQKSEYWVAEQAAIHNLRRMYPDARFFYRNRSNNANAKLGNVIDFCRRWGANYEYMFMMDADSIVSGSAIHTTLRMMEGNHRLGILQTNPTPVMRTSLFGRMQQFSGRLYGSVFSYAMQAMHMGHASYIGHNAMIRMEPFIEHCMLPHLSGSAPWGGKPLSHDIIEAAMMARAGYEVWFLPDIQGSYEEIPANILGFLQRERRWMQGNLQHLRFLFMDGLKSLHRESFINGLMGYLSAPIWFVFLAISLYSYVSFLQSGHIKYNEIANIEVPAIMMFLASMVFLFAPRIMAIAVFLKGSRARLYGGRDKMVISVLLETIFSMFLSPMIMVFITYFLWMWLRRKSIKWGTQQRDDTPMSMADSLKDFWWVSVFGQIITCVLFYEISLIPAQQVALLSMASHGEITPSSILFWFFPLLASFVGSPWFNQITSHTFERINSARLFAIPEEIDVPFEITAMYRIQEHMLKVLPNPENTEETVSYAVSNPFFYMHHRQETREKHTLDYLLKKIEDGSPLTNRELKYAMRERVTFDAIHEKYNVV